MSSDQSLSNLSAKRAAASSGLAVFSIDEQFKVHGRNLAAAQHLRNAIFCSYEPLEDGAAATGLKTLRLVIRDHNGNPLPDDAHRRRLQVVKDKLKAGLTFCTSLMTQVDGPPPFIYFSPRDGIESVKNLRTLDKPSPRFLLTIPMFPGSFSEHQKEMLAQLEWPDKKYLKNYLSVLETDLRYFGGGISAIQHDCLHDKWGWKITVDPADSRDPIDGDPAAEKARLAADAADAKKPYIVADADGESKRMEWRQLFSTCSARKQNITKSLNKEDVEKLKDLREKITKITKVRSYESLLASLATYISDTQVTECVTHSPLKRVR